LNITECWTTALGSTDIKLDSLLKENLVRFFEYVGDQNRVYTSSTYDEKNIGSGLGQFESKVYNLFDYEHERYKIFPDIIPQMMKFEKILAVPIRDYISKAWGFDRNVNIKTRCFGNVQATGGTRIPPHFHHGWDGVLVHYLTAGNEYESKLAKEQYQPTNTKNSGELLLLDPRPNISKPYNDKAKIYKPYSGMTLIHPGYVWHETETFTESGLRVCVVVNFTILNQNIDYLPVLLHNEEQ